ncbi:hypothetical protein LIER_14979 [Lithospermum erythrorhizon]|uniref:Uncharacterized protein n=1 Tax=Lithospermum erythrorhizon TaxID=34254 RepID=A0AAV3Q139_LITER
MKMPFTDMLDAVPLPKWFILPQLTQFGGSVNNKVVYMAFYRGIRYGKLKKALVLEMPLSKDQLTCGYEVHQAGAIRAAIVNITESMVMTPIIAKFSKLRLRSALEGIFRQGRSAGIPTTPPQPPKG